MDDRVEKLHAVVQAATGLAKSLDAQVGAQKLTREQALDQFREAVHAIRFDGGEGYIIALDSAGRVRVHGANPKLEGKSSEAKVADGRLLTDLIETALARTDDAVVDYFFPRPGASELQHKVAYVSRFRPWDGMVVMAAAYTDDLDAAFRTTILELTATGGLVFLLVVASCWCINRDIGGSLLRMKFDMQRLVAGTLDVEVSGSDRRDEIGEMAVAVRVFQKNAAEVGRLKAEQTAAAERTAVEKRVAMERIAQEFEAGVGEVVNTVASAATEMEQTASSMTAAASEASRQAGAAVAASDNTSTNVEAVAGAANELTGSVDEISRQVASSSEMAAKAVDDAKRSDALVAALSDAAKQIGTVTEMISEIASKTNLLALNATIEAARAGEAGKGFAVVASEVKSLAAQTAKATQEISRQIETMQTVTGETVIAIGSIGETITRFSETSSAIAAAVEEQSAATREIARNAQEASARTKAACGNLEGVTKTVDASGDAADQMKGAAGELARQAENLRAQVQSFLHDLLAA